DLREYDRIVHLGAVEELRRIETGDGHLRIGAGATYTDLLPHAERHWPAFGDLLRRLGSEPIRNSATLGGNLGSASPIGDTLPVLLALGASLVLRHGARRWTLPVDAFFLDYKRTALPKGGFVERIDLPLPTPDLHLDVAKVSKRFDQDISAVLLATAVRHDGRTIQEARIAAGGMAAIPKRAPVAEAVLGGALLEAVSFERAAAALEQEFRPLTDMRATAAYRLEAARAALIRTGMALLGQRVTLPKEPVA
ncbi:MAG: FAD binding domain-containing protein, partial [Pseudomonadota bacterium]